MSVFTRRRVLTGTAIAGVAGAAVIWGPDWLRHRFLNRDPAPLGFAVTPDELAVARDLIQRHPSFDSHTHAGRFFFIEGFERLSGIMRIGEWVGNFEEQTIAQMQAGGLTAAAFTGVSDMQTLDRDPDNGLLKEVRDFEPGEAWASYKRQVASFQSILDRGLVYSIKTVADVATARAAGKLGGMLAMEGGDFLEGRPERVAEAYADGVRSFSLLHFRNNGLGDTITGPAVHGGLTSTGSAVVEAMNEVGMLVDAVHSSEATARGILDVSTKPVIVSHGHINGTVTHPRFISLELAQAVAERGGGVLGTIPAMGITELAGFVGRAMELVDMIGIDHVCLGTDIDTGYLPAFDTYANLPYFVAGLMQQGLQEADIAKLIGGNYIRLLTEALTGD